MELELSTHAVRKMLENMGAVKPGIRAVQMIAVETAPRTRRWNLRFTTDQIMAAVTACEGKRGEESYRTFAAALRS